MVHKQQYQLMADAAARDDGMLASHIGKIGDDTFVYAELPLDSDDYDLQRAPLIVVSGDKAAKLIGEAAAATLADTSLREFSTGRAIYHKYQTLVRNGSSIIGEGPGYAQAIVDAVATKAIKPALMYQYLEAAEHNRLKVTIDGSHLTLH